MAPPTVAAVDVVAGLRLRLRVAAAYGAVVSAVDTLASPLLAAALLQAAHVPLAKRGLAGTPL